MAWWWVAWWTTVTQANAIPTMAMTEKMSPSGSLQWQGCGPNTFPSISQKRVIAIIDWNHCNTMEAGMLRARRRRRAATCRIMLKHLRRSSVIPDGADCHSNSSIACAPYAAWCAPLCGSNPVIWGGIREAQQPSIWWQIMLPHNLYNWDNTVMGRVCDPSGTPWILFKGKVRARMRIQKILWQDLKFCSRNSINATCRVGL